MKRILITGSNSYIGTSFALYLKAIYPQSYMIDTIDMVGEAWRGHDFSVYDSVFHVAGIAHSDNGSISKKRKELYYKVNTLLAIETAKKAKRSGVKQFIFMSSAIVFGESAPVGKRKIIQKNTPIMPSNFYGESKARAENGLLKLCDDTFKVVILRPPMIYGKGCKGNYPILSKIAQKSPLFPYVENERSMLYIENLCEFVRLMIENGEQGVFYPQNSEYSNTCNLVKMIAQVHKKKILIVKGFGWFLRILSCICTVVDRAFGSLCYDFELSAYKEDYRVCNLEESIKRTESET